MLEQLGGCIMRTAASGLEVMGWLLVQGCHAKVGNLDLAICLEQDVLGLQVSMADVEAVAILEGAHHLAIIEDGFLFAKFAVPVDEVE